MRRKNYNLIGICFLAALAAGVRVDIRTYVTEQLMKSGFDFSPAELPLIATGGAYSVSLAVLLAEAGGEIEHSSPHLKRSSLNQ